VSFLEAVSVGVKGKKYERGHSGPSLLMKEPGRISRLCI